MVVAASIATSPWWLGPAVNTAGIGLSMLNNYMRNRGLSRPSAQNPISGDGPIQWRDGSVGGVDVGLVPSTPNFDKAKENSLNTSATTNLPFVNSPVIDFGTTPVETETNVDFAPPPQPPKNTGNKDDDKYWKAARGQAFLELAGKAYKAAVGEEEVPVTEGTGTQLVRMPDGSVRRVPVGSTPPGATVLSVDGVPVGDKVDDFLAKARTDWLAKTARSPAATSMTHGRPTFSDEERWNLHMQDQAWRRDKGRSYNEALGPYLQVPSSEAK